MVGFDLVLGGCVDLGVVGFVGVWCFGVWCFLRWFCGCCGFVV